MRWLDDIIDSMAMSLSKLRELAMIMWFKLKLYTTDPKSVN